MAVLKEVVAMPGDTTRARQVSATRESILTAAERLFAEHGVFAVSNRQISKAAGQGNTAAVGYHFGTKADLVRAIRRKHTEHIERSRVRLVAETGESTDIRDWVACLVRPSTDHLAALGSPTWFGRFSSQLMTDPALREIVIEETLTSPSLAEVVDRLNRCLPDLPIEVRMERGDMARQLIVHMIAERERALADRAPTPRSSWHDAATGLVDAVAAVWQAPVTSHPRAKENGR
jgi:AcrR family transcriptional regulator